MKSEIAKLRAELVYIFASKGNDATLVEIGEIPTEWEKFNNTDDEWVRCILPKSSNTSMCHYKAKKGSLFPAHFHNVFENSLILNEKGKARVVTESYSKTISYMESVTFKPNENHLFEFLEDTLLQVTFNPSMGDGWNAIYNKE